MNYDNLFNENKETEFFYNKPGYPKSILVNGTISLDNAIARLKKGEYYTLVVYKEGDVLPEEYTKLSGLSSEDGLLFATVDKNVRVSGISINGGIQLVSKIDDTKYLLGSGPETINVDSLVEAQIEEYMSKKESSKMGR